VLPGTYTIEFEDYAYLTEPSDITGLTVSGGGHLVGSYDYYLTTVYVDPISGNDLNVGTSGNPVETITHAATQVASVSDGGEIIIVRPETTFYHSGSGTTRGRIWEDVTLYDYVKIRYSGPYPFVHITPYTSHSIYINPLLIGIIFD